MAARAHWKSVCRRLIALSAVVTGVLAGGGAAWADGVQGPDVSGWQHGPTVGLDWTKVRGAGESFTFVKATEGVGFVSDTFASDWQASKAAGLLHGAYHFARPSVGSAVAQADYFAATTGRLTSPGDLPPVLDLEVNGGLNPKQLVTWTAQWLTEAQARTGRRPILYTYPNFWETSTNNSTAFVNYPLWIARYAAAPTTLTWQNWTFWQYTEAGKLPGISGAVDRNAFNGSLDQLRAMANLPPLTGRKLPSPSTRQASHPSTRVNGTTARTGALTRTIIAKPRASASRPAARKQPVRVAVPTRRRPAAMPASHRKTAKASAHRP